MKHFFVLVGIASCLWLSPPEARAESDREFLNKTIKETLEDPSKIHSAKYGRRTITLERLATSRYEMRLALWTLGTPVHRNEDLTAGPLFRTGKYKDQRLSYGTALYQWTKLCERAEVKCEIHRK